MSGSGERAFVVLDIDGVLADVRHRLPYVARRPKDWNAFFSAADRDPLLEAGREFACTASATHDIVYLTGRPERLRVVTESWLRRNDLPAGRVLMRPDGDHRPATVVKLHHLRQLRRERTIDLIVDDDPLVVDAVRAEGFTVRRADWMPADRALSDPLRDAQEHEGRT